MTPTIELGDMLKGAERRARVTADPKSTASVGVIITEVKSSWKMTATIKTGFCSVRLVVLVLVVVVVVIVLVVIVVVIVVIIVIVVIFIIFITE